MIVHSEAIHGLRRREAPLPVGFVGALLAGGDSRFATDPETGLNKYLCPTTPAPYLYCASSCTASPVSAEGFDRAAEAYSDIVRASTPRQRAERLTILTEQIEARVLQYFGVTSLAQAFLCPSGTDALLTTAMLLMAERPSEVVTAILPSVSETGTGVPMAAVGRAFDSATSGKPSADCRRQSIEVPLRRGDGSALSEAAVDDAFAAAMASATGNAILYLTYGTKTGLIAPVSPPDGANVIVDACQARIEPQTVFSYLRRGWPVVVTGSKFFGGPAFSGAVLFPRARLLTQGPRPIPLGQPDDVRLGTALRWTAALPAMDAFKAMGDGAAAILANRIAGIEQAFARNPKLAPIDGLRTRDPAGGDAPGWADLPSIFTFAVHDPIDRQRLLSAAELRPLYEHLACARVLLGQPVSLGQFGGLRIAIGARNLLDRHGDDELVQVFAALDDALCSAVLSRR